HKSTQCDKPKKNKEAAPVKGRVFALDGEENSGSDDLIR
ncbi:hypothetical protein A2U01_0106893, partial [Trifolium medium]|nr:hypothetical protein [Trifolium medium]